jgi:hypothetical protein
LRGGDWFGDTWGVVLRSLRARVFQSSIGVIGWTLLSCGRSAPGASTPKQLEMDARHPGGNAPSTMPASQARFPAEWSWCPLPSATTPASAEDRASEVGECKQRATSAAVFTPCAGGPSVTVEIERCCRPVAGDSESYEASCQNTLEWSSPSRNPGRLGLASESIRGNGTEGDFDYYQDELKAFDLGAGVQVLARYYRHQQVGGLEETNLVLFGYDGTTLVPILERPIAAARGESVELEEKFELVPRPGRLPDLVVNRTELSDRGEKLKSRIVLRFERGQYRSAPD